MSSLIRGNTFFVFLVWILAFPAGLTGGVNDLQEQSPNNTEENVSTFKKNKYFAPSRGIPILTRKTTQPTVPPTTTTTQIPDPNEDPAVTRFREYLRIDTSHPNPNYGPCVNWLSRQAAEIGIGFRKIDFPKPGLFAIVMTWKGQNESLESIVLDSHIDVVPVDKSKWKHDPFAAVKEPNGDIYARGAQDRKSLGVQYLETVRRLKAKNFKPMRTVHLTYLPDEEVGGFRGMKPFVNSSEFKALNIGVVLDEGGATVGDNYAVYYGERTPWQFKIIATGEPSHAAYMLKDNAGLKLMKATQRLLEFREQQRGMLENDSALDAGDVTSINLSQLGGGLQANVVPSEMWAIFDMRIRIREPDWTFANVTAFLDKVCKDAGTGVRYEFILKSEIHEESVLEDSNKWWKAFENVFKERNLTLTSKIFPGATDARYIRHANITALGFVPLPNTVPLQHQDNEFLNENTFLEGIDMYEILLEKLTEIPN